MHKNYSSLLDLLVAEIPGDNVVQVVNDGASADMLAGRILEEGRPHLFGILLPPIVCIFICSFEVLKVFFNCS